MIGLPMGEDTVKVVELRLAYICPRKKNKKGTHIKITARGHYHRHSRGFPTPAMAILPTHLIQMIDILSDLGMKHQLKVYQTG